ncbi:MAG TPA: glycosyltransferase family 4 protein [Steroidobacteraceae bacterium]|nr:glycosyltransferase family 4 protein [Steroidobacteraceae bacterium]
MRPLLGVGAFFRSFISPFPRLLAHSPHAGLGAQQRPITPGDAAGMCAAPAKVLMVEANRYGTIGGSYFSLLFLAGGLNRAKYAPMVVFASENGLIPSFQSMGVEVRVVQPAMPTPTGSKTGLPKFFGRLANAIKYRIAAILSVLRNAKLLRTERIGLLSLNNSIDSAHAWQWAAILAGVPCVVHERGWRHRYTLTARILGRRLAAVMCVSDAVRQHLIDCGFGRLPLVTVHEGLDPNDFRITKSPAAVREELTLPDDVRLIGMVGHIQRWKGQDVVIRAVGSLREEFPQLVCIFLGEVPNDAADREFSEELQSLIEKYNLRDCVHFTGHRSDVADFVNACELLIHASIEPEPFGRVLLEGMALRKPIVASRAGGPVEIVSHGVTGFTYPPGDSEELAEHLRVLLRDGVLRASMGEAGQRRLVDSFSIEKNVASTEMIYEAALRRT